MSNKAERGTKRTCQNPECGSRFYDLKRDPIVCPICDTAFQLNAAPETAAAPAPEARAAKRPAPQPEEAMAEGDEEALPALEEDEEPVAAEEDETFLEAEEEDGSDMENIIGPVAETDEPDR